jgi:hypothetical protein
MQKRILTSFVHGYQDLSLDISGEHLPALWEVSDEVSRQHSYPFPRNPGDFSYIQHVLAGKMPLSGVEDFKSLPRFGLTGLHVHGDYVYAGSWNGVYELRLDSLELNRFISHHLMNDMHGIHAGDDYLITVLTGKDTVVLTDYDGNVVDYFSITSDLRIVKEEGLTQYDWRFLSKQFRGATGYWHFNYIQKFGDEIWLTSRNANAFVVVNLEQRKVNLRLMNLSTPVLLHDGLFHNGRYYFTSIDGKIIIAEDSRTSSFNPREAIETVGLFNRDLVTKVIRLNETQLGREPNWCRGIACSDDVMMVTIDGRYDSELSFGVLGIRESGEVVAHHRLKWSEIGDESKIKYVTGFDLQIV